MYHVSPMKETHAHEFREQKNGLSGEELRSFLWNNKDVYTTGEAATIVMVSQQTIIRCFDQGAVKGFRVPDSRFRRIPHAFLRTFMKNNGIPLPREANEREHAFVIHAPLEEDTQIELLDRLQRLQKVCEITCFDLPFAAGRALEKHEQEHSLLEHIYVVVDRTVQDYEEIMRDLERRDNVIAKIADHTAESLAQTLEDRHIGKQ